MMTIGQARFSIIFRPIFAVLLTATILPQAQAVNTLTIPGKPNQDDNAFAIVSKANTKTSHKKIVYGDYAFVPQVGKCWNVGGYKLKRGNQVLAQGHPDKWWPNTTYYTVVTPLVVPASYFPPRKLGASNFEDFAAKMSTPLKVLAPGYSVFANAGPQMIIEGANCGVKCLFDYSIFSLGKNFKKLAKIETGNDNLHFLDVGGDGSIEAIGVEDSFTNWKFSSACSPRIKVMLRFKDGKAHLATDLMKAPPPSQSYMNKIIAETTTALQPPKEGDAREADESQSDDIIMPFELPANMMELIYSGNGKAAWQFVDQVWPKRNITYQSTVDKETVTKEQFIAQFKEQLAKSPYWNDVKALNGW